jgi:hypothetical protein
MQTIETDFEFTLDDRDEPLTVNVTAEGEVEPADRSVGIMAAGIAYTTVKSVTDENGKGVKLTTSEETAVERKATEELEKALRDEERGY